jgi:hypothetical protein
MKKFLISTLTFLMFSSLQAQSESSSSTSSNDSKGKLSIDLTAGVAIASGNFIKSDYADSTSGFANSMGLSIQGKLKYKVSNSLAIQLAVNSCNYGLHDIKNLSDGYLSDFDVDSTTVTVKGTYQNWNVLVGPSYSILVGSKMQFDLHVLAGISTLRVPEIKVDLEDQLAATFYQKQASGLGFGLQAGLDVRYALSDRLGLVLNADYLLSKPNVSIENENRTNTAGRYLSTYQQSIGGIRTRLGLSYTF